MQKNNFPPIGLGTFKQTNDSLIDIVTEALDLGYRHIDTAQFYKNEHLIGKGLENSDIKREDIFITTKVWVEHYNQEKFISSVEKSLEKLKTPYVDLLLLHWPPKPHEFFQALELLNQCKEKKLCNSIGVSNFNITLLEKALKMGIKLFTNQIEFHPLIDQTIQKKFLENHGIRLTAYAPFATGQIFGNRTLRTIAERYHKTIAQVCLRWALQTPNTYPIPKTSSSKRLKENIDIFDFHLAKIDMDVINQLNRVNIRFFDIAGLAPEWD
ncbi:MAG: aldo/keto reductase [Bacteroidales bacterium]